MKWFWILLVFISIYFIGTDGAAGRLHLVTHVVVNSSGTDSSRVYRQLASIYALTHRLRQEVQTHVCIYHSNPKHMTAESWHNTSAEIGSDERWLEDGLQALGSRMLPLYRPRLEDDSRDFLALQCGAYLGQLFFRQGRAKDYVLYVDASYLITSDALLDYLTAASRRRAGLHCLPPHSTMHSTESATTSSFCDWSIYYLKTSWAMSVSLQLHRDSRLTSGLLTRLSLISHIPFEYITDLTIVHAGVYWYEPLKDSMKIAAIEFDGSEQDFVLNQGQCTISLNIAHERFQTVTPIQRTLQALFENEYLVRLMSACEVFRLQANLPPVPVKTQHEVMDLSYLQAFQLDQLLASELLATSETAAAILDNRKIYDVIYILDEDVHLSALRLRLKLLKDRVTRFIVVESKQHFTGEPKDMKYPKKSQIIEEFGDLIIFVTVDTLLYLPPKSFKESRENLDFILDAASAVLSQLDLRDDDILMYSTSDDVLDPLALDAAMQMLKHIPYQASSHSIYGKYLVLSLDRFYADLSCFEADRPGSNFMSFPAIITQLKFAKEITQRMGNTEWSKALSSSLIRQYFWLDHKVQFFSLPQAGWRLHDIPSIEWKQKNYVMKSYKRKLSTLSIGYQLSNKAISKVEDIAEEDKTVTCMAAPKRSEEYLRRLSKSF